MNKAEVDNIEIFNTIKKDVYGYSNEVKEVCIESIHDCEMLHNETVEELINSNNLLEKALADEALKLSLWEAALAELTAALASENEAWIAKATAEEIRTHAEYDAAVIHRQNMERRFELARQCEHLAKERLENTMVKYNALQNELNDIIQIQLGRVQKADNEIQTYTSLNYKTDSLVKRRTDEELEKDNTGLDKKEEDYQCMTNVLLSEAVNLADSITGVYIIYLDNVVMKCGRAAYKQGIHWRFQQYYSLSYDDKARHGDYWAISEENRDRIIVSWQCCPVSKCKELEYKLFEKYGKGPWGLRAPATCPDDSWKLLI